MLVRKLFDRFGVVGWIDGRANREKGFYRPGLMTEVWIALLLYGGGVIDDLPLLERRGVRRIFGWTRVPAPRRSADGSGGQASAWSRSWTNWYGQWSGSAGHCWLAASRRS